MGDASSLNPAFLKDVFVLVVVLAGVVASLAAVLKRRHIEPQPLRTKEDAEYVELKRYERDRTEVWARIRILEEDAKRDRENIMAEITIVPDRVVELLRKTKGLL